tara:strand:+ start:1970 stop:2614 length:645 start_codon:yes stop_codon:yes gene_type:complete
MGLIVSEFYSDRYPDGWRDFDRLVPRLPMQAFGISKNLADVNRWAARYRAAASYERISMAQYQSQETVAGYGALIRSILVWSAFERFLPLLGLEQKTSGDLLDKYNSVEVAKNVRKADSNNTFYEFIKSRVDNNALKRELESYFDDNPCNVSYLLSAIRHIFGHGYLTPGSNETDAQITAVICNLLCDFHLDVMNSEFTELVNETKKMDEEGWR